MRTAYLYDEIYLQHDTGSGHPESKNRLIAINEKVSKLPCFDKIIKVDKRKATIEELEYIHDPDYVRSVKITIESGIECLDDGDTVVSPNSYEIALYAAGGCLNMCDMIMSDSADAGFCAVRPPGHHAERTYAYGFCIFNNIAICAKYLQKKYSLERIAIIDWDVHHGNGTQHSFENDPSVYFFSFHQYPYYPGSGNNTERGIGKGKGYTLNIPMESGSGDDEYLDAFETYILPELENFAPQIILISAGFDAHKDDTMASMNLTTDAYVKFTKLLQEIAKKYCKNKIIAILEGGYNLNALADSVSKMIETFIEE